MVNPAQDLIPESAFADDMGKSPRTVKRWRQLGIGPSYIRIGKTVYYRPEAIRDWLDAREHEQPRVGAA